MFVCTVCVYDCPLCVANTSYGEAALVSTIAWYVPMECCVGTTWTSAGGENAVIVPIYSMLYIHTMGSHEIVYRCTYIHTL